MKSTLHSRMVGAGLGMAILLGCTGKSLTAQDAPPKMPMQAVFEDGAEARWLKKKVLDSRVLDSMEDMSTWSFLGDGDMALADSP